VWAGLKMGAASRVGVVAKNTRGKPRAKQSGGKPPQSKIHGADSVASWGAALRSRTAGSQDESRCNAIHKQRPYRGSA